MVRGKMLGRRLMLVAAVIGFGSAASAVAYKAAGAAMTIGSYAIGR